MMAALLIALFCQEHAPRLAPVSARLTAAQSAALRALARGEALQRWPEMSAQQARALEREAEAALRDYRRYHQPHGTTADVWFRDASRRAVAKLDGIGDSATWHGHYLAALAFRWSVRKDAATLRDIRAALGAFERLASVSGRDGYLARYAGPAESEPYRLYYSVYGRGPDPARPGLGTWAFAGEGQHAGLVWLGNSSRDVLIGANLGLAATWRLVSDPEARRRTAALVERILERLIADNWWIDDGRGHRTIVTPTVAAALLRTGASVNPARYGALYAERAERVLALRSFPPPKLGEYFPNNLRYAQLTVLCTLEDEPSRRARYAEAMRELWRQSADHLNAHFAAMAMSATGDTADVSARATLQGCLLAYPAGPRWARKVDLTGRPDIEKQTDARGRLWARHALPVEERVPTDFLWQRSPCLLEGGGDAPLAYPRIDLFLPYWMGRHAGALPAPR